MSANKQLDLLLENPKNKKKIFIKYHLGTKLRNNHIYDYIEELYNIDEILTKDDDLIIITKEKVNDNLKKFVDILYKKDNYYINVYNYTDYLFNILDSELQPKFKVLNESEKQSNAKI